MSNHITGVLINHPIVPIRGRLTQNLSNYLNNRITDKIRKLEETLRFFTSAVERIKNSLEKSSKIYEMLILKQIKTCQQASNRLKNDFDPYEKREFIRKFDKYWSFQDPDQDIQNFLKEFHLNFQELFLKFRVTKNSFNGRNSNNFLQVSQNLSIDFDFNNSESFLGPLTKNLMFNSTKIRSRFTEVVEIDRDLHTTKMLKCESQNPSKSLKVKLESIEIHSSKTYTFSVYLKYSKELSDQMKFSCQILNPGTFDRVTKNMNITKEYPNWYRISQSFTTSSSFSSSPFKVAFSLCSLTANLLIDGFLLFCDFQLEESDYATPFCKENRECSLVNLVDNRPMPISRISYNGSEVYFDGEVDSVTCNAFVNFGSFSILAIASWQNIDLAGIFALGNDMQEDPKIKAWCSKQGLHISIKPANNVQGEEFTAFRLLQSQRVYCIAFVSRNEILDVFVDGQQVGGFRVRSSFQYFSVVAIFRSSLGIVGESVKPKVFQVFANSLNHEEVSEHFLRCGELTDSWGS
jgi:hypothetical protein